MRRCMNKLEADNKKEEIHHFTKVDEMGFDEYIIAYVLKAEYPNKSQYAIGLYSRGEGKEMRAHGKRHTEKTGHRVWEMETSLQIN